MQTMLDTIGSTSSHVPTTTAKVAGYVTGTSDIAWTAADWARFPHSAHVRIDQSPDGRMPLSSDVLDVETGAATPDTAVAWVKARIAHGTQWSTIYGTAGTLGAVHAALEAAGPHGWYYGHVNCWLADWNLNEQSAAALLGQQSSGITIVAVQWASPTSNPHTPVPGGSGETLAQANVDISAAADGWMPAPGTTPPPPRPIRRSPTSLRPPARPLTQGVRSCPTTAARPGTDRVPRGTDNLSMSLLSVPRVTLLLADSLTSTRAGQPPTTFQISRLAGGPRRGRVPPGLVNRCRANARPPSLTRAPHPPSCRCALCLSGPHPPRS